MIRKTCLFLKHIYLRYIYKMTDTLSQSFSTDSNKKCTLSSWMKSFRINDLPICRIWSVKKNIINFLSLLTKNTTVKEFWVRVVIFLFIPLLFIEYLYHLYTMPIHNYTRLVGFLSWLLLSNGRKETSNKTIIILHNIYSGIMTLWSR